MGSLVCSCFYLLWVRKPGQGQVVGCDGYLAVNLWQIARCAIAKIIASCKKSYLLNVSGFDC